MRDPSARQPSSPKAEPDDGAPFVHDYLGYLLGQANHALFKDFDATVRAAGIGSLEWRVLAVLAGGTPMSVGELAREVLSQQPTVTKLLQRLAAHDWVTLRSDPCDQRRTMVAIAATGRRKVTPLLRKAREREAQVLSHLSPTEIHRLKDQLRRLARTE